MIPGREVTDAIADRLDHTRSIGHRDAAVGGGGLAGADQIVVEVQRAGVQLYADFAGAGLTGIGPVRQRELVEPAGRRKRDRPHLPAPAAAGIRVADVTGTVGSSIWPFMIPSPFVGEVGMSMIRWTTSMPSTTRPNTA